MPCFYRSSKFFLNPLNWMIHFESTPTQFNSKLGLIDFKIKPQWSKSECTILFPHDVQYALKRHHILFYMLVLLKLRFNKYFHENRVNLYLKTSLFGDGHFLNGFIVLNVDYNISNVSFSLFTYSSHY
jgi:hypothetical protein